MDEHGNLRNGRRAQRLGDLATGGALVPREAGVVQAGSDLGCGTGLWSALSGRRVIPRELDPARTAIDEIRRRVS